MDHIKAEKRAYIVLSVAQLALGAYLIARPEQSFSIACYAIGTVLVVYGIIKLIIPYIKKVIPGITSVKNATLFNDITFLSSFFIMNLLLCYIFIAFVINI